MFNKTVLPLLSIAGLCFAIYTASHSGSTLPTPRPTIAPPSHPEFRAIAGSGIVESRRENIPIDSPVQGVVWEVAVKIHDRVKAGDALYRIDDRTLKAELTVRESTLEVAEAQLAKLEAAPRPEDLPPARAAVEEARARLKDTELAMSRSMQLLERHAGAPSEYDKDRFAFQAAKAAMEKTIAELARLESGTWERDIAVARAQVRHAKSMVESTRVELDRLTVRALTDGEVLQVNVRPGQVASLNPLEPQIVLGDVERLHLRVDIDERELPRFRPNAKAVASPKGRPEGRLKLEFVDVEPYVIPKRRLTGENVERVDTRVLQVIYALPKERPLPLYIGQQMDVYVEADDAVDKDGANPRAYQSPGSR